MNPVLRWSTKGMFAGVEQKLREMKGSHRWLIRFERTLPPDPDLPPDDPDYGKDQHDCHEIFCDEPVPLPALGPKAEEAIKELYVVDGVLIAKSLTWTAYWLPPKK